MQARMAELDTASGGDGLPWAPDTAPADGGVEAGGRWSGLTLIKVEDGSLVDNSPTTQLIAQQVSLVDIACHVVERRALSVGLHELHPPESDNI